MWLVFLLIHWTNFTQWCLREAISLSWTECPHAAKTTLNLLELRICMVFCCASLWKLHMDLSKIIFETKINCFAFSESKKHHFFCKTTKNEQQLLRKNYFRPRHHQLLSWQVPKSERFPSGFRALPKTHLKPHFAHFRTFLNIFEQNEWQIRFPQPILRWFPKSDFGHWSTPLNILRISASNVLKMFLNITVGIGCAGVIFHSYKPTGKVTGTFIKLAATLAGKKEL